MTMKISAAELSKRSKYAREFLKEAGYEPVAAPAWAAIAYAISDGDFHRDMRALLNLPPVALGFLREGEAHVARFIDGTASDLRVPMVITFEVTPFNRLFKKVGSSADSYQFDDEVSVTLLHEYGHAFIATTLTEDERPAGDEEEQMVENLAQDLLRYDERAAEEFRRAVMKRAEGLSRGRASRRSLRRPARGTRGK